MLYAIKRLALGFVLIAAASAVLLVADLERRQKGGPVLRIAIVQHANTPVLDEGIRGTLDALVARGYRDGERINVSRFNAQGDMATGIAIAKQVTASDFDLVITSSTPAMQAVANNNKDGRVRHIFTLVADPFSAGVGLDRADPLKHPPFMVGQGTLPPARLSFELAKKMLPGLQTIGTVFNPAESNSVTVMGIARPAARELGLNLLEANADNSSAVAEAVNSVIARGAEAIWIGADNTMISAVNTVIAIGRRSNLPVFSVLPGAPDRGTIFDAGPNFYEVGKLGGNLAADVLEGADMSKIPVQDILDVVPTFLSVNRLAERGLAAPWRVPDDVIAEADVVVDESGMKRKAAAPSAASAKTGPLSKKWKLSLVMLMRVAESEEAEHGVLDGLKESGLVEGRDFERITRDAQGDMATVSGLVDTALAGGADMLITFSTPTLQAAIKKTKTTPIVFNYVADPIAAGAGTSNSSHQSNVTGSYLVSAFDRIVPVLRGYLPRVKTVGSVYSPAEVNMVVQRDGMIKTLTAEGIVLKTIAANSAAEVGEAAVALVAGGVDAIVQLPGNLTISAFPSIAQVAKRSKTPLFGFQSSQAKAGALAVVARDYYDAGREAAHLAARIMRGESPERLPFVGISQTKFIVNLNASRDMGLQPPPALLAKADEVIGK